MLLELDKFDGVVIFATNLARNYDGAFVRRIPAHIEFELPDEACLVQLWKYLLPEEVPRTEDTISEWLVQESLGLAGGDILNVVKLAASQAVSRKGNDRLVMQSDIKNAIAQVKNAKEKIGSTVAEQQPTTTVKTLKPDAFDIIKRAKLLSSSGLTMRTLSEPMTVLQTLIEFLRKCLEVVTLQTIGMTYSKRQKVKLIV